MADDANEMVKRHFDQLRPQFDTLNQEDKTRFMLDRFLKGEIDLETYKQSLEVLHRKNKDFSEVGYV